MNRSIMYLFFMAFLATLLTGCNTARGFGEDIKHLGGAIEHAVDK